MRLLACTAAVLALTAAPAAAVAPPDASTGASPGASAGSVTFAATVDAKGSPTTYFFQYGATRFYGSSTSRYSAGQTAGPQNVTVTATGAFLPGETYHFRVVAQSRGGTTRGADQAVTMPPPPLPVVTTGSPSSVAATSAMLNATEDPGQGRGTCWFELGTTSSYGLSTAQVAFRAGATRAVRWSTIASGLTPATTYHYRFVTSTLGGIVEGADETFTTPPSPVRPFKGAGPLRMLPPGMHGPLS